MKAKVLKYENAAVNFLVASAYVGLMILGYELLKGG